ARVDCSAAHLSVDCTRRVDTVFVTLGLHHFHDTIPARRQTRDPVGAIAIGGNGNRRLGRWHVYGHNANLDPGNTFLAGITYAIVVAVVVNITTDRNRAEFAKVVVLALVAPFQGNVGDGVARIGCY